MTFKRTALYTALLGTLATCGPAIVKYPELHPYVAEDIKSEMTRQSSKGNPTSGLRGARISLEEHVKTLRDVGLFTFNDLTDNNPEFDLYVDKTSNVMEIYRKGELIKTMRIGSGILFQPDKPAFGQYVTPNGQYMVINFIDREGLERKFGEGADLYGNGIIQLSGPWAPYIAIHGTFDESKIGARKSNGCVNVTNTDLEWLMDNIGIGSRVYVK